MWIPAPELLNTAVQTHRIKWRQEILAHFSNVINFKTSGYFLGTQTCSDDSEPVPERTLSHTDARMFSLLLCFTCFLICLCWIIIFFFNLWEKEWPEHACLTFCYLLAGAHIREKVHFVVLCVLDLSTAHAFQTVCCFLSGHSHLCLKEILREIMSWIEHFMNISLYRNV